MYDFLDKIGLKAVLEAVKGKIPTVSNPNLLINPDFKINQRGVSGVFSETGKYFVDRWKLVSGTVTVNNNGTITLNGIIRQEFDVYLGRNITPSVSAGRISTGIDPYTEKIVYAEITAENETISWAKLEYGNATTPFIPPDPTTEFLKCCRFYQVIDPGMPTFGIVTDSSRIRMTYNTICPMRKKPEVSLLRHTGNFTWSFKMTNAAATSSSTITDFSAMSVSFIRSDGETINVYINVAHTLSSGEIIYTSGNGGIYFALDAEI